MITCPRHALTFAALILGEAALWIVWAETSTLPIFSSAGLWAAGVLTWTLLEYLLHRFAFHLPPAHGLSIFGARQHFEHHTNAGHTPITKPLLLTLPALALGYAATIGLTSLDLATPIWSGLIAGYLGYEVLHVAAHMLGSDEHPLPGFQRAHLDHHRDISRNFGITSPLWDRILGTRRQ